MTKQIRNLRIASPCHVVWEAMSGDERVRFCDSCKLHVYNFSELTSNEINELILKTEGRICGRLYRRADGTVLTRDCPVGIRAFRKNVSRVVGAAFATILGACSFVFGQNPNTDKSCKQIPSVVLDKKKPNSDQLPGFTGTVLDPMGAVLTGATVTLFDLPDHKVREQKTNDQGAFSFKGVADGTYSLQISLVGFKNLVIKQVELRSAEITTAKVTLDLDDPTVTVGIVASDPLPPSGTTTIGRESLKKLPIN